MVGFPGESETAFCNTTALATDLPFSYLHVFPYSLRPGTAAARLDGSVPPTIVKKRVDLLHELDRTKRLAFHNAQIGMTVEALFETGAKEGYCFGTTPNFTRMAVATSAGLENRIVPATVTAATDRWVFGQPIHHQPADSRLTLL
jgi:threonylcarbamoyladenosine tRNA methylthiotransferase MtaB